MFYTSIKNGLRYFMQLSALGSEWFEVIIDPIERPNTSRLGGCAQSRSHASTWRRI